jgi:hypothetical protein
MSGKEISKTGFNSISTIIHGGVREGVEMTTFFVLLAGAGFAASVFAPIPRDHIKRKLSQGASTAAISVGLFGSVFQVFTA